VRHLIPFAALLVAVSLAPAAWAEEVLPAAPAAPAPATVVGDGCCGCCSAPSTCCPPRDRCRPGHLEIQGHASFLTPEPEGTAFVDFGPDPARWDGIDYGIGFGGRVAWTNPLGDWDLRAAGTLWGWWSETGSDFGTLTSTPVPGGAPTTVGPQDLGLHTQAVLWDVAVTLEKPWSCSPCFTSTWGFGVRYLRFDENSDVRFVDIGGPARSVETKIDNGLLAAEVLATAEWKLSGSWSLRARASAFAGWMRRDGEQEFKNPGGATAFHEASDDDLGFGGELELSARWHVNSCWSLSAGYGLLVVGNVARGYEGLDSANVTANQGPGVLLSDDVLLVHRVFVGVEFDL
jgi:hypothetical protein